MLSPIEPPRTLRLRPDGGGPLEALLVAAGPHLEPVLDVGTGAGGDLVVQLPAPRARLTALLAARESIGAGEAVTLLVPLLEASASMHAAGVAHGAIGLAAVLLDDDGSPYWCAPDGPVLARLVSPAAFALAVAADRAALLDLAATVLRRAGLPVPAEEALSPEWIFALAEPEPIRFTASPQPQGDRLPQRLVPPRPAPGDAGRGSADAGPELILRGRALLRSVRPRVWAAAGTAAVLLLLAVMLLPSGSGDAAASSSIDGGTGRSGAPAATRAVPSATTVPRSAAPAAAVRALLDERARCLAAGDARCLERVAAPGSPVLSADRAAVAAGVEAVAAGAGRVVLRAANGGTALAEADGVTVLAVRQPDGWRLRDVVEASE